MAHFDFDCENYDCWLGHLVLKEMSWWLAIWGWSRCWRWSQWWQWWCRAKRWVCSPSCCRRSSPAACLLSLWAQQAQSSLKLKGWALSEMGCRISDILELKYHRVPVRRERIILLWPASQNLTSKVAPVSWCLNVSASPGPGGKDNFTIFLAILQFRNFLQFLQIYLLRKSCTCALWAPHLAQVGKTMDLRNSHLCYFSIS